MKWMGWIVIEAMVWSGSGLAEQLQTLLLPVSTTCISSPFGPRSLPNRPQAGTYHYGLDLPAPKGSPVRATIAGVLLRVQHNGPGGLEVLVQHSGFVGVYSHLGLIAPRLESGRRVTIEAGEQLGVVGHTGVSFGPHLYFGMLRDGQPVNPAPLLHVPLCGGGHSPGPVANPAGDEGLLPSTTAVGNERPLIRPSPLLDDFRPARGCSISMMVRTASPRFNVERGGRTGIARYTCPEAHGTGEEMP
jgi:Peptidase family M23